MGSCTCVKCVWYPKDEGDREPMERQRDLEYSCHSLGRPHKFLRYIPLYRAEWEGNSHGDIWDPSWSLLCWRGRGMVVSFLVVCDSRVFHLSSSSGQVWSPGHDQGLALYNVSVGTSLVVDATSSWFLLIFDFPSYWNKVFSFIIFSDYGFPSFYSSQWPHHPSHLNPLLSDCNYKLADF